MTIIDTQRLRLRSRAQQDMDPIIVMDTDPEVRRFMGGPLDPEIHRNGVTANIIAAPPLHWAWAIEWKDSVGFLGMCLLRPLEGTDFICIGWRPWWGLLAGGVFSPWIYGQRERGGKRD